MNIFTRFGNFYDNLRRMSEGQILSPTESTEVRTYIQNITTGQGYLPNFIDSTGESISAATAMRISTYFSCLQVRWDAVGMLPLNIFQSEGGNKKNIADIPAQYLLHSRPNPSMTASRFWKQVQQFLDNHGNAYCPITRDRRGQAIRIDLIKQPWEVEMYHSPESGELYYSYKGKIYMSSDILHFKGFSTNGIIGLSLTDYHSETIGRLQAIQKFSNRSMSENPGLYATSANAQPMAEPQKKAFKDYWAKEMNDMRNRDAMPVLYNGFDLKTVGINPKDAMYLDQIQATKEDIYGITRVPPKLAQNYHSGNTYNNSEQQGLDFVVWTLQPLLTDIEQELDYKLFSEADRSKYHCKFNEKVLLRMDSAAQAAWIEKIFGVGGYSINDIRSIIDENPVEGGDDHYVPTNNLTPLRLVDEKIKAGMTAPLKQTQKNGKEVHLDN